MKSKLIMSVLGLALSALLMAGCSSTTGYSESDLAKAKLKGSCSEKHRCKKRNCNHCSKTIYTAKDRMTDEIYK